MSARCQACHAETRDNSTLCKICYRELQEAVTSIRSSLHELSVLATGQAKVERATGPPRPEPAFVEHDTTPAWLRTRDGQVALPATRLPVNEAAREQLYVGLQTIHAWAQHIAAVRGINLAEQLEELMAAKRITQLETQLAAVTVDRDMWQGVAVDAANLLNDTRDRLINIDAALEARESHQERVISRLAEWLAP